ncbi:hypothetical protein BKK79_23690 [Cupriavidus sp. USMAA2-4]|uniref:Uncharacterized protein n=1 Tax=Cupriavidus malaysiensis TaxID=367825 RepID=A0ABM7D858_9BURK|nr:MULTISPECIES: hypothetical protein [Cupriavidus]AOY94870.1 hypothetical protein BKK79_23690 [Cupriavidus sp. USMAA2-4]AOZ10369.1 hypothetical protein BKK80_32810 [Cupriavidus malaysiensis]
MQTIDQNRHPSRQPNQHDAAANIVAVTRQAWGLVPAPGPYSSSPPSRCAGSDRPAAQADPLAQPAHSAQPALNGAAA